MFKNKITSKKLLIIVVHAILYVGVWFFVIKCDEYLFEQNLDQAILTVKKRGKIEDVIVEKTDAKGAKKKYIITYLLSEETGNRYVRRTIYREAFSSRRVTVIYE
ncbi:hypothetical protein ACTMEC_00165 (plasmid) [Enterococcus faecalis]|uniref:hypothetical protein n=1 Tax=Enterococcus TaxID=1350 RepID=UPI000DE8BEAF|nr:hypothetical protein [Enterococcus faecalis]MDU2110538.1 hypothetical protein [Peptoniphilus lacydonensis]MDU8952943.1 hypothetical protein [Streptococcus sp.]EGO2749741.1 hypothetical protein [Enterococcus faecalis]EGO6578101.1 hypothetical protein [Enterococcus faecalis]EGO6646319.1 hypothetical protein [Enterococcus faecalis]